MERTLQCTYCRATIPAAYLPIHHNRCYSRPALPPARTQAVMQNKQLVPQPSRLFQKQSKASQKTVTEVEKFECYLCGHMQSLSELDDHFKICPNKQTECPDCSMKFPRNLMVEHRAVCNGPAEHDSDDEADDSELLHEQFDEQDDSDDQGDQELEEGFSHMSSAESIFAPSRFFSSGNQEIQQRRVQVLNRLNRLCEIRSTENRDQFYHNLIRDLQRLHQHIRQRAAEEDRNKKGGMTKTKINQLPNKRYKADPNMKEKETCSICFVDFNNNDQVKNIACRHLFHVQCISEWLKRNQSCPNCKRIVSAGPEGQKPELVKKEKKKSTTAHQVKVEKKSSRE